MGPQNTVVPVLQSDIFYRKIKKKYLLNMNYKRIENQGHGFTDQTYSQAFKDAGQTFFRKKFEIKKTPTKRGYQLFRLF